MSKKESMNFEKKSLISFFIGLGFIVLAILTIPGARVLFNIEVSEAIFYPILVTGLLINIAGAIMGVASLRNTTSKKLSVLGIVLNTLIPLAVVGFYTILYVILVLIW